MIYFAVFLVFVCYFYDILRKGAPLLMLLLGVGDGIAWQGTKLLVIFEVSQQAESIKVLAVL